MHASNRRLARRLVAVMNSLTCFGPGFRAGGLSAVQIGVPRRLFVMRELSAKPRGRRGISCVLNPVVLATSREEDLEEEMCASLPDLIVPVPRARGILVRYQDLRGATVARALEDQQARIFLHELDHLDGKLISDYAA